MRASDKHLFVQAGNREMFGVDFFDGLQKEISSNREEFSSEFGIRSEDVQKLKKKLERS